MENDMKVKIVPVGSGVGIRLSAGVLKILGAKKDDLLDLKIFGNEIRLVQEKEEIQTGDSDLSQLLILLGKMKKNNKSIRNIIEEEDLISLFLDLPKNQEEKQ
jgi:hypothetical protein